MKPIRVLLERRPGGMVRITSRQGSEFSQEVGSADFAVAFVRGLEAASLLVGDPAPLIQWLRDGGSGEHCRTTGLGAHPCDT